MLPALTSKTARPLPPPPSLYSKHSWWSDRNSIGATFSLHAATKPFLAYLYHRQVRQLLAKRASMAISDAEMNVLATYLIFQYTSSSTRVFVLQHISANICAYPEASQSVIGALVPCGVLSELLNSERQTIHEAASRLVAQLLGTSSRGDREDWFPMFSAVGNNTLGGPHGPRIVSAIHCFLRCTQLALEIDMPPASLCSKSLTDVMVFAHFPDVYEWIVTNIIEPLADSEEPQGGSSRILAGAWTHIYAQESRFFPPSSFHHRAPLTRYFAEQFLATKSSGDHITLLCLHILQLIASAFVPEDIRISLLKECASVIDRSPDSVMSLHVLSLVSTCFFLGSSLLAGPAEYQTATMKRRYAQWPGSSKPLAAYHWQSWNFTGSFWDSSINSPYRIPRSAPAGTSSKGIKTLVKLLQENPIGDMEMVRDCMIHAILRNAVFLRILLSTGINSSRDPRFAESARTIYLGAIKNTMFSRWLTADYPMSEPIEKLTKVASEPPSRQIKQWAREVLDELDAGTK
ncbi:Cytochrome P450 [Mycena chlorophos]|uniref:Cytochrome P450 n=1 Tax=Mycena chlorophos TaxID=658473 RepID=A0A8H6VR22_MYCCL|nr:Cytochrome P450 [Mycena chlorophos]